LSIRSLKNLSVDRNV